MGMMLGFAGIVGAVVGLVIGGLIGFFKSKKINANKTLWTILGSILGFVLGGVGTFFVFWEYVKAIGH